MTIKQAIKKAVENGYRGHLFSEGPDGLWGAEEFLNSGGDIEVLLLDPEFWKALGKAEGWDDKSSVGIQYWGDTLEEQVDLLEWGIRWHQFIDHLADGGTIEEYFKEL